MSTAAALRTPESVLGDERIISADYHVIEPEDLWSKNLPAGLKEKYPNFPARNSAGEKPGGWNPRARIDEIEVDGVSAEVLYPTLGLRLFALEDAELQEACFRIAKRLADRILPGGAGSSRGYPNGLSLQHQEWHQRVGTL